MSDGFQNYQALEPVGDVLVHVPRALHHPHVQSPLRRDRRVRGDRGRAVHDGPRGPDRAAMLGTSWLLVLGGFMVVSWLASRAAHRRRAWRPVRRARRLRGGAGDHLRAAPLHGRRHAPGAIPSAALVTLLGFAGLTAIAFTTRKDFSFLGGHAALGRHRRPRAIVAGVLFGFELGTCSRRDGRLRRRRDPLRHLERHPPLPGGPLRRRLAAAVRLRRADVLVRPPDLPRAPLKPALSDVPAPRTRGDTRVRAALRQRHVGSATRCRRARRPGPRGTSCCGSRGTRGRARRASGGCGAPHASQWKSATLSFAAARASSRVTMPDRIAGAGDEHGPGDFLDSYSAERRSRARSRRG